MEVPGETDGGTAGLKTGEDGEYSTAGALGDSEGPTPFMAGEEGEYAGLCGTCKRGKVRKIVCVCGGGLVQS